MVELIAIWYDELGERIGLLEHYATTVLTDEGKAGSLQRGNAFAA